MRDRVRRAGLHTVAAENAARVVDVIDLGVAVPGGNAIRLRVFCGFDVYAIRRTGCSAQETPHTFFVPIFVALQHVNSPVARLDAGRNVRVRLRRRLAEHGQKSDAEAFNERDECFANFLDDGWHCHSTLTKLQGAGKFELVASQFLDTASLAEYRPLGSIPGRSNPQKSVSRSPRTNISAPSGPAPPRRIHHASKFLEACARTYTYCRRRAFSRSRPRPGDRSE